MKATAAEIVEVGGQLTARESQQREAAELDLDKGAELQGKALSAIFEGKLWRSTHESFADYCRDRVGISLRRAQQHIAHAEVIRNLTACFPGENEGSRTNGSRNPVPIPVTERASREISDLPPKQQREVIDRVTQAGKKPTAANVREAREKVAPRASTQNAIDELLTAKRVVSRKLVAAESELGECDHSAAIGKALEAIQKHGEAWKCK